MTIDGPAASGKSSVSRELARKLQWTWLSTGVFYRGLAFVAQVRQIPLESEEELAILALDSCWEVIPSSLRTLCFFNGVDVTDEVYLESTGAIASRVSLLPKVRASLLRAQRKYAEVTNGKEVANPPGLIAEGRDCGTVIFPQALVKFFLTAERENRALRRVKEQGGDLEATLKSQAQRDANDTQRTSAPLRIPEGAHLVDTSHMSLEEVIDEVYSHILKCISHTNTL